MTPALSSASLSLDHLDLDLDMRLALRIRISMRMVEAKKREARHARIGVYISCMSVRGVAYMCVRVAFVCYSAASCYQLRCVCDLASPFTLTLPALCGRGLDRGGPAGRQKVQLWDSSRHAEAAERARARASDALGRIPPWVKTPSLLRRPRRRATRARATRARAPCRRGATSAPRCGRPRVPSKKYTEDL